MGLPLDTRTIQRSNKRLVISGPVYELYEYEEVYFYNWPPDKRTTNESISQQERDDERREDNLRASRRAIRRIVESNISEWGQTPKFITFTFAEEVRDLDEANRQWGLFCKRARYEYGYPLKYLAVVEFHPGKGTHHGVVHYHAVFFNMPYREYIGDYIAGIWKQGFVRVKGVTRIKALGAYISKYLTKGNADARLNGRKAYFCARGIRRPLEFRNPATIDRILARAIVIEATDRSYQTRQFGTVNYSYKITEKTHAGSIESNSSQGHRQLVQG